MAAAACRSVISDREPRWGGGCGTAGRSALEGFSQMGFASADKAGWQAPIEHTAQNRSRIEA